MSRILSLLAPTPDEHRGRLQVQAPQRERELAGRKVAVELVEQEQAHGRSLADVARDLGLDAETLRTWQHKARTGALKAQPLGRPPHQMPLAQRQQAIEALDEKQAAGVGSLRQQVPGIGRNDAGDLVRRHRRVRARRRRRRLCRLEWRGRGVVWAVDGTWLLEGLDGGRRQQLLTIVDLGAKETLCCQPICGERADEVIASLELAVSRFGVPLLIKWDNGSGFIACEVRDWCAARGITLLHSPPRQPSYNGGCEVRNRWAKVRIRRAAAAAGRPGCPQRADLVAACTWSGQPSIVDATTRGDFLTAFANELTAVCAARGVADLERQADHVRRSLESVAARRALELCHILMIRGRKYRW